MSANKGPVDLPPERFENICAWVDEENTAMTCRLVCRYWKEQCRSHAFKAGRVLDLGQFNAEGGGEFHQTYDTRLNKSQRGLLLTPKSGRLTSPFLSLNEKDDIDTELYIRFRYITACNAYAYTLALANGRFN